MPPPAPKGSSPPSEQGRAARGASWAFLTGTLTRVIGMGGMLVLTRVLDPTVYGEVTLASIVVTTVSIASVYGMSQHLLVRPRAPSEEMFHAAFYFTAIGALALVLTVWLGPSIGAFLHAPGLAAYLPGLALATLLERAAQLPDRIQTRLMQLRALGLIRAAGEVVYVGGTLGLAWAGWGGQALVIGSIARAVLKLAGLLAVTHRRDWVRPARLEWGHTREVFAFGVPITIAWVANIGARIWDNLLFAQFFGPGPQAVYNTAYNVAEIPSMLLGAAIGDVLTARLGELDDLATRRAAMLRALGLLMLISAPLTVGLAAVAPTVTLLFDARWSGIGPMLASLALFAVLRPIAWIGNAYLQVDNMPRALTILEVTKALAVVVLVALVGRHGPLWVCAGTGVAFGLNSLAFLAVLVRYCGFRWRELASPLIPPMLACIPMGLAVVAVGRQLTLPAPIALLIEVLVGAVVFIPSALLLAPAAANDLLLQLRAGLRRRLGGAT